ncbi:putative RING-H2 finger protein ATL12 [Coffea arabica]
MNLEETSQQTINNCPRPDSGVRTTLWSFLQEKMGALSKFFLSPIYKATSICFSKVLPEALKFLILSAVILWSSYRRQSSRHEYMAQIDKQSCKFVFRKKLRPSLEAMECSICLCEIEEGDEARELHCNHVFHKNCLEKWLQRCHATCPLCRSLVVPEEVASEHKRSQAEHQLLKNSVEEELALMLLSTMTMSGWSCHSGF